MMRYILVYLETIQPFPVLLSCIFNLSLLSLLCDEFITLKTISNFAFFSCTNAYPDYLIFLWQQQAMTNKTLSEMNSFVFPKVKVVFFNTIFLSVWSCKKVVGLLPVFLGFFFVILFGGGPLKSMLLSLM